MKLPEYSWRDWRLCFQILKHRALEMPPYTCSTKPKKFCSFDQIQGFSFLGINKIGIINTFLFLHFLVTFCALCRLAFPSRYWGSSREQGREPHSHTLSEETLLRPFLSFDGFSLRTKGKNIWAKKNWGFGGEKKDRRDFWVLKN